MAKTPTADRRGHCLICGGLADHVHTELPEEVPAPPTVAPDPDMVIMVELDPKMVAAFAQAEAAEKAAQEPVKADPPKPKRRRRG
jgi:hypothetical protein